MKQCKESSRQSGWHRLSREERRDRTAALRGMDADTLRQAMNHGGLTVEDAELMIENVIGTYALPFAVAPNFVINGRDVLVPMVVEEASVVAAAANAARLARAGNGFTAQVTPPVMIGQIQLFAKDVEQARQQVTEHAKELLRTAREADPVLVRLGGGPVHLETRLVPDDDDEGQFLVLHLHVDVRDAMGANAVNTMCERLREPLETLTGGRVGLCILSNLADQRMVKVATAIPVEALDMEGRSGTEVAQGIVLASLFAEMDPYRAATHNKGIMNGLDAVLLATGNDWRAVEAGAHAYAARKGGYAPLATWRLVEERILMGRLRMPMAVGIVGGTTKVHPGARAALDIMGAESASDLAMVAACAGLASNLAALRALSTEGIQRGHMRLHERSRVLARKDNADGH